MSGYAISGKRRKAMSLVVGGMAHLYSKRESSRPIHPLMGEMVHVTIDIFKPILHDLIWHYRSPKPLLGPREPALRTTKPTRNHPVLYLKPCIRLLKLKHFWNVLPLCQLACKLQLALEYLLTRRCSHLPMKRN